MSCAVRARNPRPKARRHRADPAPPVTAGQVVTPATPAATTPAPTMPSPAAPAQDPYEAIAKRFAGVLATADKEATAALAEAKAEAGSHPPGSPLRGRPDQARRPGTGGASEAAGNRLLAEAKREAEQVLGSLSERREALVTQMHDMQSKLLSVATGARVVDRRPGSTDAPGRNDPGLLRLTTAGPPTILSTRATRTWWALPKGKKMVDIPDLAGLDVDFEEEPPRTTDSSASVGRHRRLRP